MLPARVPPAASVQVLCHDNRLPTPRSRMLESQFACAKPVVQLDWLPGLFSFVFRFSFNYFLLRSDVLFRFSEIAPSAADLWQSPRTSRVIRQ